VIDYLRDPSAIYDKSFRIIRSEANLAHIPADAEPIAVRIIHACGMVEAASEIMITEGFAATPFNRILVDAEMVRHGIIPRFSRDMEVICTLNDPAAKAHGLAHNTTRSAAAVDLWTPHLDGALVVIGNAPTALFRLLELIDAGAPKPIAVAAFPVGFVGAAESKEALIHNPRGLPFATIKGRKGGSAMAAACANALLEMRLS
jgi:precorrin-8X/cobalt-precorrin-8 methylmutase